MSIVDIFAEEKKQEAPVKGSSFLKSWYSFACSRLVFFLLLGADVIWLCYLVCKLVIYGVLQLGFMGSSPVLKQGLIKGFRSIRCAFVCALCLFVSFFSPAFGVMIGYAYFIVYDKQGPDGILPAGMNDRLKEILSVHREKNKEPIA